MNNLTIKANHYDDCIGLEGRMENDGFSGFGEAYFNISTVRSFCEDLKTIAKEMNGSAELVGSEKKQDGSGYLETLALRCYVLSASKLNGVIGVHITLSDPPSTNCRKEEIRILSGELQVRNHKIHEFSDHLSDLIIGSGSEIVLAGDLNNI